MFTGLRLLLRWPQTTRTIESQSRTTEPAWRFVVGGWLLLSLSLLIFVLLFGQNSPLSDEWAFLPELTGEKPFLQWLWEAHNEHRFPLPRLVWVAVHRASGYDFRAPMVLSVILMAGTTLALLTAVRNVRGRAHAADLLIPALLLHFGHWENVLIGYQLAFTIPAATTGLLVATLASATHPVSAGKLSACGFAIITLALCGGPGLLLSLPLATWMAFHAVQYRRYALFPFPLLAFAYAVGYLILKQHSTLALPHSRWEEKATTAIEVLACGMGGAGRKAWPLSGIVIAAFWLVGVVGLLRVVFTRPGTTRQAALVLLAVLAGVLGIAAAIGISRTGVDAQAGFSSRYALFPALGLATLYVASVKFLTGPKLPHLAPAGVLLALVIVALSSRQGIDYGQYYRHATRSMQYRVRQGDRPEDLAHTNVTTVFAGEDTPQTRQWMLDGLHVLARHRIGVFRPAKR